MNIEGRIKRLENQTGPQDDGNETVILVVHGDAGPVRKTIRLADLPQTGKNVIRIRRCDNGTD